MKIINFLSNAPKSDLTNNNFRPFRYDRMARSCVTVVVLRFGALPHPPTNGARGEGPKDNMRPGDCLTVYTEIYALGAAGGESC